MHADIELYMDDATASFSAEFVKFSLICGCRDSGSACTLNGVRCVVMRCGRDLTECVHNPPGKPCSVSVSHPLAIAGSSAAIHSSLFLSREWNLYGDAIALVIRSFDC